MGKKIKSREARARAAAGEIAARLRVRAKPNRCRAFIDRYAEFAPAFRAKIETYRGNALRAPEDWRCGLRSRSPERRFLELVRFTFARYPAPRHLENAWIDETHAFAGQAHAAEDAGREGDEGDAYRGWYIIVTQGGSLYQHATGGFLSRLETHHLLNAPDDLSTTARAVCYALARAQTKDASVALRVARSRLSAFPFGL